MKQLPTAAAVFSLAALAGPTAALAHVGPHAGAGDALGFGHGLLHPLTGLDHILAMVSVGLFAAQLAARGERRALWLVPLAFVGTMALGGVLGATGVPLPGVETMIGLSVVALGLVVAFGLVVPVAFAVPLVALFALFHGHAHGAEMPASASGLAYGAGFVVATVLLHAAGVSLGLALGRVRPAVARPVAIAGGTMVALAGAALLGGAI